MALSLQQMRDYIRTHLDLEVEDLPDTLVDAWLREGSKRIERAEVRWPHFEKLYLTILGVNDDILYPLTSVGSDLDQVARINFNVGSHPEIHYMGYDAFQELRAQNPTSSGRPRYYTVFQQSLLFYPALDTDYEFMILGFRKANDWVDEGAGATPDLPDELHNTVMTWGLSKAYAQQEDPEMAAVYERQFADEVKEMTRRLNVTPLSQPLVMNGGAMRRTQLLWRPRFDWEAD